MIDKNKYLSNRNIDLRKKISFHTPRYITPYLPKAKDAYILDIGCGQGSFIGDCVTRHNRTNVKGIDISQEAIDYSLSLNLPVEKIESIKKFAEKEDTRYDFILMSHVIEHIEKNNIIDTLCTIRTKLLKKNGCLFLVVPNAQSATNAYWAYEDFTHHTLFTTGSLSFVLQSSGYKNINFVDLNSWADLSKNELRKHKILLALYKKWKQFERYITRSYYHTPSPISFAYEIKAVGYNL